MTIVIVIVVVGVALLLLGKRKVATEVNLTASLLSLQTCKDALGQLIKNL